MLSQNFEGFKALLDGPVDEKVLMRAFMEFSPQIQLAYSRKQAQWVYNRALQLPGSSTKRYARQHEGLLIGDVIPNLSSRSGLVYAFKDGVPMLLKIPSRESAKHEAQVWQELSEGGPAAGHVPPGLAGPVKLLTINKQGCKLGLLMPLYPATLQHIPLPVPPIDVLAVGRDVHAGLQHMHQRGWGHCDVKPPNIFLAADGSAGLGDFGAARKLGEDVYENTSRYLAIDLPAAFQCHTASVQLDEYLLAVTLLEKLGLLQLTGSGELTLDKLRQAVMQVPNAELKDFILSLLNGVVIITEVGPTSQAIGGNMEPEGELHSTSGPTQWH